MIDKRDLGPVELLAVGFESGADYRGRIIAELDALERHGVVRVLDLLFLTENERTHELRAVDYRGDELGAVVSEVLGFPFGGAATDPVVVEPPRTGSTGSPSVGLSRDQLANLVHEAPPDIAMAFLLIEHVWARNLMHAIRDAGGTPLAEGFLSAEVLASVGDGSGTTIQVGEAVQRALRGARPSEPPEPPSRSADYVDELERLALLHTQGVLTHAEYGAKKRRVLGL